LRLFERIHSAKVNIVSALLERALPSHPVYSFEKVVTSRGRAMNSKPMKMSRRQRAREAKSASGPAGSGMLGLPVWVWLAFVAIVAGAGTLAVFEWVYWKDVPPELVGTWDVEEGPLAGGIFRFSRNGNLEMRLKQKGKEIQLNGQVAVVDKTLRTKTRAPLSGQEETTKSIIRELTARTLILELESGDVLKMGRWK
jgi:hypothetical protein